MASVTRTPSSAKTSSPDRGGCRPTPAGGARNRLTEIGGCRPTPSGGPRNHLTEIGGCRPPVGRGPREIIGADPPRREGASKLSSRRSGGAGGFFFTMLAGAFARMACAWRSIFTRAKTSTGKMTTASDHVAPVHRNLPPSIRSAVIVSLSAPFCVSRTNWQCEGRCVHVGLCHLPPSVSGLSAIPKFACVITPSSEHQGFGVEGQYLHSSSVHRPSPIRDRKRRYTILIRSRCQRIVVANGLLATSRRAGSAQ
jgi:hypothetical protein